MDAALATWVPPPVLIGILSMALGALFKVMIDRFKKVEDKIDKKEASDAAKADKVSAEHERRMEKFESMVETKFDKLSGALDKIEAATNELDKRFGQALVNVATRDMLGSMGDRFDGRLTGAFQEIASNKTAATSGIDVLRSEIGNVRDEMGNLREELRAMRDR